MSSLFGGLGQHDPLFTPHAHDPLFRRGGLRASSTGEAQLLPSASSAIAFVAGERGAWMGVVRDVMLRSCIAGIGLYAAGEREALVKKSVAVAGAIEVVVLGIAFVKHHKDK